MAPLPLAPAMVGKLGSMKPCCWRLRPVNSRSTSTSVRVPPEPICSTDQQTNTGLDGQDCVRAGGVTRRWPADGDLMERGGGCWGLCPVNSGSTSASVRVPPELLCSMEQPPPQYGSAVKGKKASGLDTSSTRLFSFAGEHKQCIV